MKDLTFTFIPVKIERGRKFRGKAYSLGFNELANQVAWNVVAYSVKLWDPAAKRFVYANPDFVDDDDSVAPEQVAADKLTYITTLLNETKSWCSKVKSDLPESELKQFVRNCFRKRYPMYFEFIEDDVPDQRDVVKEIQRTIEWALTLKTRPCHMYGKFMPGGKPYPPLRSVKTALHSLIKKCIYKLDGFKDAWQFIITTMGLPVIDLDKEIDSYLHPRSNEGSCHNDDYYC